MSRIEFVAEDRPGFWEVRGYHNEGDPWKKSDTVEHHEREIMSEPIWNKFLTERDKAVFAAAGYGVRAGFGKRPALLVIDVSYAFAGDRPRSRSWNRSNAGAIPAARRAGLPSPISSG